MTRNYNEIPEAQEIALWRRVSKNGAEYLSGIVKINGAEYKVVAFENTDKQKGDKKPDYSFKQKNGKIPF